jgi:imidazolonepropionase-like amidohydrolase
VIRIRLALAAAITACALGAGTRAQAQAQPLVLTNASVVDAAAPNPVRTATIIVQNGRIVSVAPAGTYPRGARVVDARGKFVIPGLWEMHGHLAMGTPIGRAPEQFVAHGVLNVRDMGGFPDSLFPLRAAIRADQRVGPELVVAGFTLNGTQPAPFHQQVTTADEARAAVRAMKAAGADLIKVHRTIGRDAFLAAVDEAKRQGLRVSGHVPVVMSWIDASNAGIQTIEHIQTIFENVESDPQKMVAQFTAIAARLDGAFGDSIFAAMRANGTVFDPTLIGYEASIEKAAPAVAAMRKVAYEQMKRIAARAARSGVQIVTGTDVLERHGEMLWLELERLVGIGMTPQQVLLAATVQSADAARRPELGTLKAGAPASFVMLDANPLNDIKNVRSISAVVLRGQLLDSAALTTLRR